MVNSVLRKPLPLTSLNHISLVCKSVEESVNFYENVLGFVPIKRPGSFGFDGAWLFNYGVGIHLLQCDNTDNLPKKSEIDPMDNHISFQCESMEAVEKILEDMKIKYVKRRVEEGGLYIDQIFMHDPDGFMIEMCNCEILPVVPLGSSGCLRVPSAIKQSNSKQSLLKLSSNTEHHEGFPICG
ncbi:glyoxylase I 4 [Cryptomeria japonica]|uniref:glyoxylase I 4 n=1 Tax=Cryptomeria japonica TaxID=3369 RepID=UPI0027DA5D0C|nr:glyoxylase I 4 [Cryptomeria japonica]